MQFMRVLEVHCDWHEIVLFIGFEGIGGMQDTIASKYFVVIPID
jgi:hypothetical protein